MYEACLKLIGLGYFEIQFAFEGLADENVWKRPAPQLLSIGEIAGHLAYAEAIRLAGEGEDLSKCQISSPLIHSRFWYYPRTLESSPTPEQLAMTAAEVHAELLRVHEAAIANFKALNPAPDARIPGCPCNFTYGDFLEYLVFHVAYHTGQMYSVRHLFEDGAPDN